MALACIRPSISDRASKRDYCSRHLFDPYIYLDKYIIREYHIHYLRECATSSRICIHAVNITDFT